MFGSTKDPGRADLRVFKAAFPSLVIDPVTLVRLDLSSRPLAKETREWALELLGKEGVFKRADHREFLLWGLWHLGVEDIPGFFPLRYPGPDHQARWMSDTIGYSKILACSSVYSVPPEKLDMVKIFVEFIVLFYMRGWFESSMATMAARSDLTFMKLTLIAEDVQEGGAQGCLLCHGGLLPAIVVPHPPAGGVRPAGHRDEQGGEGGDGQDSLLLPQGEGER